MENKKRAIYAEDLLRTIRDDQHIRGSAFARVKQHIDEAATVEDVEVTHGRWEEECGLPKCPVCGYEYCDYLECKNYCGNCGAKMDGGNGDG